MILSFRIGKIPVRILPSFFLVVLFLGAGSGRASIADVLVWLGVVLVSVLLHELGHATAGLAFGLEPQIQLHGMGGTTTWSQPKRLSTLRHVVVGLAGPMAGFAFGALVFLTRSPIVQSLPHGVGATLVGRLLWVNVGWGVLNLLPMLPLDGGTVMAQGLNALTGGRGERPARIVSIVVAAAAAIAAALGQWWWSAMMAAWFVMINWRGLKDLAAIERDAPMRADLQRAYAALEEKDAAKVLEIARPIALSSRSPTTRAEALQLLAFGFLYEGRVADADAAIAALPKGFRVHPSLTALRRGA